MKKYNELQDFFKHYIMHLNFWKENKGRGCAATPTLFSAEGKKPTNIFNMFFPGIFLYLKLYNRYI